MTGVEKQILKIVRELELADEEAIGRKMLVSSEYVKEICKCLVKSGHLLKAPEGGVGLDVIMLLVPCFSM